MYGAVRRRCGAFQMGELVWKLHAWSDGRPFVTTGGSNTRPTYHVVEVLDLILAIAREALVELGRGALAHDHVRLVPPRAEAGQVADPIVPLPDPPHVVGGGVPVRIFVVEHEAVALKRRRRRARRRDEGRRCVPASVCASVSGFER